MRTRRRFDFMIIDDRLTVDVFIEFLKRRSKGAAWPVYVIVDRHPVHRSAKVRKFVESQDGRLRSTFLPSYSPELNPDELVWNHLKNHQIGKKFIAGPDQLKKLVISALRQFQNAAYHDRRVPFRTPCTIRGLIPHRVGCAM